MKTDRTALSRLPAEFVNLHPERHIDPLLRRRDVLRATGLTQSALYRLIKANTFPKPVAITDSTSGWRQSEIIDWIDSRPPAGR